MKPLIAISMLLTLAATLNAAFVPDFKLKPDDFTVLMGVDAELSEGLTRVSHSAHGKFQVTGWTRADQSATWKITAGEAAPHEVFVLVKRANNQSLAFKLAAAGQSLRGTLPANPHGWQRISTSSRPPMRSTSTNSRCFRRSGTN